jgi:hypothetical protein
MVAAKETIKTQAAVMGRLPVGALTIHSQAE